VNTLSKVFVIVNLVFAVAFCFMTLTLYSKRVDFKSKWEQERASHGQTKVDMGNQIDKLTTERDALSRSLDKEQQKVKELVETNANLNEDLKQKAEELFDVRSARDLLVESGKAKDEELQRRHDQIDRMHKIVLKQQQALEVAKANLRNAQNQRIEMENELNNARQQLIASQKEKARLEKDLHHNSWIIETLMEHGVPIREIVWGSEPMGPTEAISGQVLAVRPEVNLVMLSVGSDEGVKKGYRFTVYRGEEYVGKVEVEKVFSDMSSARILTDWTRKPIKENDDASTRVY
jgi:organic radical activating enzyme